MAQELIYTSFPKGVKPGASGFCTVAVSPDMAPNLISRLEGLSGYRHLYMPGTPKAEQNPPNWSHLVIKVGNTESHVICRVADAGLDYTGRSNLLAHFIVLDKNDLAPCGPAVMLTAPGLIDRKFDQKVGERAFTRSIPLHKVLPGPCSAWLSAAGDPGWAGLLAQTAWTGEYACIVYKEGMNVLTLIREAMALLPEKQRWKTTFSTYYSKLPTGIDCQWRCVVAETPEADQAIAEVGSGLVIDLSKGALAKAPDSPAVLAAREGKMVTAPVETESEETAARQRQYLIEKYTYEGMLNDLEENDSNSKKVPDESDSPIPSGPPIASGSPATSGSKPASSFNAHIRRKSGPKVGMFIAMIIGVILVGIAVAAYFVLSTNFSGTDNNLIASSEDVNSNNQTESSDDTDDSDLSGVINHKENSEAEKQKRREMEERARLEREKKAQEKRAKKEAEERQKKEEEEKRQKEAEEKARLAAEEQAKKEAEEKARLAAEAKARKEAEDKIFNDQRWVGADRDQFFIYVDSNDVPDCTRLNIQLQKQNSQIVKLELVPIYKNDSGFPGFELEQDSNNDSRYVVLSNKLSTDIVFQLNDNQNENPKDESDPNDNKQLFSIEGENAPAFSDFTHQNFLLATFSDKTTAVISFFRKTPHSELRTALVQATLERLFNGSVFTIQTDDIEKTYSVADIRIGCFGDSVRVNNSDYKIASAKINKENSCFEIQIDIKPVKFPKSIFDTQGETEKTLQSIVVGIEKDNKTSKFCKIKYSFVVKTKKTITKNESEAKGDINVNGNSIANPSDSDDIQEETIETYGFGTLIKELYSSQLDARKKFLMLVKELGANVPLYIDVYIQGDPIANDATSSPFLWKRIVLPSFEGSGK